MSPTDIIDVFRNQQFLFSLLVAVAVGATVFTLASPYFGGAQLKNRMKSVAVERDQIRARERAKMLADKQSARGSLRVDNEKQTPMKAIVERLDLKRALADEKTIGSLRAAGFRGQQPLNVFLFLRLVLPFLFLVLGGFYIFGTGMFADKGQNMQFVATLGCGAFGFYAPNLYISNKAAKRQQSIQRAWPDAIDLLLICVESGMSIEAAFRKVSEEIGTQSIALAEELVLVGAELSYLQERRQAYENLGNRTGLETVKSVTQALIQSERYGTPVGTALRVLAKESRELRMLAAEKKAAALPPKLTVPMIVFFLPVLFAVILGPAGITISNNGGIFPS